LDKKDEDFIMEYKNYQKYKNEKEGNSIEKCYEKGNMEVCNRYLNNIKIKILEDIRKKGWTGLRQLKLYLKSVITNGLYEKRNYIEKTEFKYHIYRWGITSLNDNEIDLIFKVFGKNCNNTIDYIEFLNYLHIESLQRKKMIVYLINILKKNINSEYINFSSINRYMNMNYHPEVIKLEKDKNKAEKEFIQSWGYLKEDDLITIDNFIEFFEDISTCLPNDEDFDQCLYAISYNYFQHQQ
jgi:Ca2+-binding EF-hand superfamily protein